MYRVAIKPWGIVGAHLRVRPRFWPDPWVRPYQKIGVGWQIRISRGRRLTRGSCPLLLGGNGAALGAMVRKILKNDALAVILP